MCVRVGYADRVHLTHRSSLGLLLLSMACGGGDRVSPSVDGGDQPAELDAGEPAPRADATPDQTAQMYAHTRDTLYAVDGASFDLIEIGSFGVPGGSAMNDLAITPDGQLFGVTGTKLFSIDPASGAATFVAPLTGSMNVGMTFLPDGSLLAADKDGEVRRVRPDSGAIVEVGAYGDGYGTAGDLVAVADGTMYTIADDGPDGESSDNVLLEIDPTTGAIVERIGSIGFAGVWGTAYAGGKVYAFTRTGDIIQIDPASGVGTLVRHHEGLSFYGAGVSPLVDVE
jgi:streptogramin lyase